MPNPPKPQPKPTSKTDKGTKNVPPWMKEKGKK